MSRTDVNPKKPPPPLSREADDFVPEALSLALIEVLSLSDLEDEPLDEVLPPLA
jgi:hypothetical protein